MIKYNIHRNFSLRPPSLNAEWAFVECNRLPLLDGINKDTYKQHAPRRAAEISAGVWARNACIVPSSKDVTGIDAFASRNSRTGFNRKSEM